MKLFLFLMITIFFFIGCSDDEASYNNTSSNNTLPITTEIYKAPLAMSFHSVRHTDTGAHFSFIAEHTNDMPISSDDYQFHWPKYISDDNDVIYEVKSVDYNHREINNQTLTNDQLAVTLTVSPPPPEANQDQVMQVPFYIVPRLFEQGYPFRMEKKIAQSIEVGDLILENTTVKGRTLSFDLFDQHPDQNQRNLAYLFTISQDNQDIYPVFSKIKSEENHLQVQLNFAQNISLPVQFTIERTTVDLPEWRFSFVIPMSNDQTDE